MHGDRIFALSSCVGATPEAAERGSGDIASAAMIEAALAVAVAGMTAHPVGFAVIEIGEEIELPPEEAAMIEASVARRRREFAAGRLCARRALAAIGGPWLPIPMGRLRQPIWPSGYDGSISHDRRFAASLAYALTPDGPFLAFDLIDTSDLTPYLEIIGLVARPGERWAASTDAAEAAGVFSAKEAAIKILSPRLNDYVDFKNLEAVPVEGGFRVALEGSQAVVAVRTLAARGVILSVGMIVSGAAQRRDSSAASPTG
jgi:4'-phosphopantetheinyl transferase EntD